MLIKFQMGYSNVQSDYIHGTVGLHLHRNLFMKLEGQSKFANMPLTNIPFITGSIKNGHHSFFFFYLDLAGFTF